MGASFLWQNEIQANLLYALVVGPSKKSFCNLLAFSFRSYGERGIELSQ
jgi:hypothetical protein